MMMCEWVRVFKENSIKTRGINPGLLATGLDGDSEALKKMGLVALPILGGEFVGPVVERE
jgi:hypothetical protein